MLHVMFETCDVFEDSQPPLGLPALRHPEQSRGRRQLSFLPCVPVEVSDRPTEEPHWPPQPRSPNSCSVFSHTAIGRGGLSIQSALTRGPAPAAVARRPIGYCTSWCSAIGRSGWLSRLRGFIHHFATVV